MSEEFKGGPKNKWSRIYRKKWFFPAVYLTIAAVLLSVVVWYQNLDNQVTDTTETENLSEEYSPIPNEEGAEPVIEQQELIQMPVEDLDQAEIVTKFFDYNAEQEDRENALVLYNNRFYQSTGVDIASADAETFDVLAALTGTVEEVKEDPLLGNVVILLHGEDVKTYYASLEEVSVSAGAEIKQGEKLGTAGKNIFGKDNGTHVHFEIRKDGKEVNPESYFNQPVSSLGSISEEAEEDSAEESDQVTDMDDVLEENPGDVPDNEEDDSEEETDDLLEDENE
ncbi:M23 family metallopeptidase [Oceanobacillus polygoni]|uniref:Stage II sporulation protein Q n=1 Tax=Oceanobacillus polygoni TaxID=1235259 RepID=A0A9X1CAT2_9BACI|nr:M23 family metallopeptidase [Oceanobacillus polygoni]MBP2076196.1 stage II sporulation protein Q [Oceanobacillus polygoni]